MFLWPRLYIHHQNCSGRKRKQNKKVVANIFFLRFGVRCWWHGAIEVRLLNFNSLVISTLFSFVFWYFGGVWDKFSQLLNFQKIKDRRSPWKTKIANYFSKDKQAWNCVKLGQIILKLGNLKFFLIINPLKYSNYSIRFVQINMTLVLIDLIKTCWNSPRFLFTASTLNCRPNIFFCNWTGLWR